MNILLNKAWDFILKLIYPPKCMVCKKVKLDLPRNRICEECHPLLDFIGNEALQSEKISIQYDNNVYLKDIYFNFIYDGIISALIKESKYNNHPVYNRGFAHFMADYYSQNIAADIDLLACVPIHKNRYKSRGFNQSAIIAKELSKILDIPFAKDLIIRNIDTKPQSGLSRISRRNNVENAFSFNKKYSVDYKKIMIIDDIYTTGSTLNSCAGILMNNGAKEVYGFCFSKTSKKGDL